MKIAPFDERHLKTANGFKKWLSVEQIQQENGAEGLFDGPV